jgi:hypothetical protein
MGNGLAWHVTAQARAKHSLKGDGPAWHVGHLGRAS